MLNIRFSKDINEDFINRILFIDSQVFTKDKCGTYESLSERYKKNKDSFILLYDDEMIVGYICLFPIEQTLYNSIMNSSKMYDDNIKSDQILGDYSGESIKMFLISIAILKAYQNKEGIVLLTNSLNEFIKEKNTDKYTIGEIVGVAMSIDGEHFFDRLDFKLEKVLESNYKLYRKIEERKVNIL